MSSASVHRADQSGVAELRRLLEIRRSIRGFRPDPVPRELIERAVELAGLSPSNCNSQPWILHIVSGQAADKLRRAMHAAAESGAPVTPDFPVIGTYPDAYRERQIGAAKALYEATDVQRDDRVGRRDSLLRNFRFFDAPHVAFLFTPDWAGPRVTADCGGFAQSFLLALTTLGIGSCAQGALALYADLVRENLGVDSSLKLLVGIAFGYADPDHPANTTTTPRALLSEIATFHD